MKKKNRLIFIIMLAVGAIIIAFLTDVRINRPEEASENNTRNKVIIEEITLGTIDGLDYELWKENGITKMTLNGSGAYECEWLDSENVVFRIGKKFPQTKKLSDFGEIQIKYGADYQPKGNSFFGVYGWTKNPLAEYYIVENWGDLRPDDKQQFTEPHIFLGRYEVNGELYDVYSSVREEKPSIVGIRTFPQYWSVRASQSSEGTIDISRHFEIWESNDLTIGDIFEISLAVEGIKSSGYANVYLNEIELHLQE